MIYIIYQGVSFEEMLCGNITIQLINSSVGFLYFYNKTLKPLCLFIFFTSPFSDELRKLSNLFLFGVHQHTDSYNFEINKNEVQCQH